MCFSAEADLVAGAAVGAIAVDCLRHVTHRRQLVLAAVPLLLAVHQIDEAVVWGGLDGRLPESAGHAATIVFLFIAFALPVIVPLAVLGVETSRRRRQFMSVLAMVGAVIGLINLVAVIHGPTGAAIEGHHIAYAVDVGSLAIPLTLLYVITTCGALLASSERIIVAYGAANLLIVAALAWASVSGLTSLWCAWAAVTSVAVAVYLRHQAGGTELVEETPGRRQQRL